jgi:type IV pilus assembly protein PilQ
VKHYLRIGGAAMAGAALVAMAPVPARATDITNVQISQAEGGINILLDTSNGDRPEVFAVSRGNSYVADIINAQLRLPQGNSFREDNPAPGIAYIEIMQIDANSVRVVIAGTEGAPRGRIIQGAGPGIILSAAPGGGVAEIPVEPAFPPATPPGEVTQLPIEVPSAPPPEVPLPSPIPRNEPSDVLLPEPTLRGGRDSQGFPGQRPGANVPPFQPRAVAPPVGDIAISNINPGVDVINLNTGERIPRLVLRDAPVRDVLALLARAAGLNIAYAAGEEEGEGGMTISLDIEDESVQDVFNYVLRLSGLQANRVGKTIFVGSDLPKEARNVIVRTFRLNQISARAAAGFLASMGAESATTVTRQVTEVSNVNIPGTEQSITNTQTVERTQFDTLRYEPQDSPALLRGLQVIVDTRLNSLTLVGLPSMVEIAASQLVQLDLRKRQVAVNVKVIDVNLSAEENFNSSFSFGINDTFFVNDEGAATLNFGNLEPPNTSTLDTRFPLVRPRVGNPLGGDSFFDPDGEPLEVPFTGFPGINGGRGTFIRPVAPVTDDPTRIGITEYQGTELDPDEPFNPFAATFGEITVSLFPTILYPQRLLAQLQAQIVSGNGKILTDPTLVVQEGEIASVRLVEEIVKSRQIQTTGGGDTIPTRTVTALFEEVGLVLAVQVERIDDNGFVTMTVNPDISAPVRTRGESGSESFVTEISRRKVESGRIRLRDGQTLILSGIIQEQERTEVSKIPILGDLPIVGSLFRNTDTDRTRAEVIVLVTPQVMDDSDRSSWGYQYNPSPDALEMMNRGQPTPRR